MRLTRRAKFIDAAKIRRNNALIRLEAKKEKTDADLKEISILKDKLGIEETKKKAPSRKNKK
jgi:hypothetical protein